MGTFRWWQVATWVTTFAAVAWLLRGALDGGSVLGVGALAVAAAVATGAGAFAGALAARRARPASVSWRSAGRLVAGMSGALGGLCAALVAAVFTWAAFSGCLVHCDEGDRSPVAGVVFGAVTAALAAGAGWSLGWGLGVDDRVRRILAAGAAALVGGLLVVTAAVAAA